METFSIYINFIPDVVWAAILASLLTLGGVIATNRGNRELLANQLLHDSEQRDRERSMDLRREVFLKAVEAIATNNLSIMSLGDLNISDAEISKQYSSSSAALSKLNLIASNETIKAISKLSTIMSKNFLRLSGKRFPLMQRQQDINIQSKFYDKSSPSRDQMLGLIKEYNLQGKNDESLWKTITKGYEFANKQCLDYIEELKKLTQQNTQEQIQLTLDCLQAAKEVSEYLPPAIREVRNEMDIPFDENAYKELTEEAWEVTENAANEYIEKVKAQIT
jgi:hypothetical protein